jgi:hypothetical protein
MVVEPKPKALRRVTWIFGTASRRSALNILPAHLRMPSRSAFVPAITPGLSARKITGRPKAPAVSRKSIALIAAALSTEPERTHGLFATMAHACPPSHASAQISDAPYAGWISR